jgi:hypothetical protein
MGNAMNLIRTYRPSVRKLSRLKWRSTNPPTFSNIIPTIETIIPTTETRKKRKATVATVSAASHKKAHSQRRGITIKTNIRPRAVALAFLYQGQLSL